MFYLAMLSRQELYFDSLSLRCVPEVLLDTKSALVQVMAWRETITWTNHGRGFCHHHVTSWNENIFRVTDSLYRSPVVYPHKGQHAALMFLWSALEQTIMQTIETPMIWDVIALIMTSL